jgi:hypothetical protein
MGDSREDRLHLRRIEWIVVLAACAAGGVTPAGTFSGEAGRLLITFLGLISASVLPTISLILGSMSASGRSVQSLNALEHELSAAMDALFALFGLVALAVAVLLSLAIPTPEALSKIPHIVPILGRSGQAILCGCVVLIAMRAGQIPGILRRSLEIRHRIAVDEARRRTIEAAPRQGEMTSAFPTHADFGKTVNLGDIRSGRESN